MPALVKDKAIKRVTTPARVFSKSMNNSNDVKRLGPSRRISTRRIQAQSIQTQTALVSLILQDQCQQTDGETQTMDPLESYIHGAVDCFAARFVKFIGGTIVSFVRFFKNIH